MICRCLRIILSFSLVFSTAHAQEAAFEAPKHNAEYWFDKSFYKNNFDSTIIIRGDTTVTLAFRHNNKDNTEDDRMFIYVDDERMGSKFGYSLGDVKRILANLPNQNRAIKAIGLDHANSGALYASLYFIGSMVASLITGEPPNLDEALMYSGVIGVGLGTIGFVGESLPHSVPAQQNMMNVLSNISSYKYKYSEIYMGNSYLYSSYLQELVRALKTENACKSLWL